MGSPSSSSTPASSPDPIQEDNTVFWQDMDEVMAEKEQDLAALNESEDREDQVALNRLQSVIDGQSNSINGPSDSMLNVLNSDNTTTAPSPMNLAGGASAPTTTNNATKMNNNLNGV